jgi:hypothetical protein
VSGRISEFDCIFEMTGSGVGYLGPEKMSYAPGPLGERMVTEPSRRFSGDGSGEAKVWGDTDEVDVGAMGWIGEHGGLRRSSKKQAGSG